MRKILLIVKERSLADINVPALLIAGKCAADHIGRATLAVRDEALLVRLRRRPSEEWNLGPQVFEVPYSEPDLCTCLRATCLQFCSSGKNCNQVAAERGERRHESTLETGSISQQEHDRRDSPRHAEHGQHASTAIVPHGLVSFVE